MEGRRKKEEGRGKKNNSIVVSSQFPITDS